MDEIPAGALKIQFRLYSLFVLLLERHERSTYTK